MANGVYAAAAAMFAACGPCIFETRRAKHRRLAWKYRHDQRRAGRRQPHPMRVARFCRWLEKHPRSREAFQLAVSGKVRLGRYWLIVGE